MGDILTIFLIGVALLAIFTRETFLVALFYMVVGAIFVGRWWAGRVVNRLVYCRKYTSKAFPGESIPVQIDIQNGSRLPAVWLRVQDFYPLDVAEVKTFQEVISLGPKEMTRLNYTLMARKRGYYTIGPLLLSTGDLLGLSNERSREGGIDHITVYPKVIPLSEVKLPSRSPMGTLRTNQLVFEDPSRPMGTRDYQAGDSLRRIDWKATASTSRLQTRLFEPSIALETVIFLDLNVKNYFIKTRFDATELAIVATASLGTWVSSQRQAVGMITNGFDPLTVDNQVVPLLARKGRAHVMRILEELARVRPLETSSFAGFIQLHRVNLSWGTTLILITGSAEQDLFDELIQARRSGLNPVIILCGEHPTNRRAIQICKLFHIPVYNFLNEKDLDIWRK